MTESSSKELCGPVTTYLVDKIMEYAPHLIEYTHRISKQPRINERQVV